MRRLCLLVVLGPIVVPAACSRPGAEVGTPEPGPTEATELIVTADGVVECVDDGIVSSSDLRGC